MPVSVCMCMCMCSRLLGYLDLEATCLVTLVVEGYM